MTETQGEERQLSVAAWSSVIVNIVLTVGKGAVGLATGSRALLADAIHSAADVVGSLAVIIGLRIARKPPDADHPYGHGKAEILSTTVVAVLLVLAALDVGYSAVRAFFHAPIRPEVLSAYTAAIAIVVKEFMFQYSYRLGTRFHSKSLLANAYDHRSDVFSSCAALVGILLSLLGQWKHIHWLLYMDAAAGAFVSILVLRMGVRLATESAQMLMDKTVEPEDLGPYRDCILSVAGVEHIDDLRVRDHGRYVIVDVKISVDADITVQAGHAIAADAKQVLMDTFSRIQDVLVHVNPYFPGEADGEGNT